MGAIEALVALLALVPFAIGIIVVIEQQRSATDSGSGSSSGSSSGSGSVSGSGSNSKTAKAILKREFGAGAESTAAGAAAITKAILRGPTSVVGEYIVSVQGVDYYQYYLTASAPAGSVAAPEMVFNAFTTPQVGTVPIYRHSAAARPEAHLYSSRAIEPGFPTVEVAFHTYPMDFPNTKPVWQYQRIAAADNFRLSSSSKIAEAAPDVWSHYYSVDRPVFWAPI